MLKRFIRSRLAAFERAHDYDMGFARALLEADLSAFMAFAKLMPLSRYRRDVPREVYWAAKLTSLCVSRTTWGWKRMRRDRIARARSGLRQSLQAMLRRPCGFGSGATRSLAAVST